MGFEDELGAQPPLGFFDPLGLVEDGDQEKFDRLRYTEIKHGRISMLAFLGQITTRYGIHLGGSIDNNGDAFDSFPSGIAAIQGDNAIPGVGLAQIVAFIGVLELFVMKDIEGTGNEFAGDLRNGSLDLWSTKNLVESYQLLVKCKLYSTYHDMTPITYHTIHHITSSANDGTALTLLLLYFLPLYIVVYDSIRFDSYTTRLSR